MVGFARPLGLRNGMKFMTQFARAFQVGRVSGVGDLLFSRVVCGSAVESCLFVCVFEFACVDCWVWRRSHLKQPLSGFG